jgi:hypothetical protein
LLRLYARDCVSSILDNELANAFVDEHHSQGSVTIATKLKSIALYHKGELVAVAQFCYPRTEKAKRSYTTELLRLAFRTDTRIVGGASKLIAFYKNTYKPTDMFTYQDTTGEVTEVYEKAGFTLVSQSKTKAYLVAPGKTLETATRKEALGMAYATRYGPDRILRTKLGEQLRDDGTRKSNEELFYELGWHREETSGDRIYEWLNPNVTFYTYKTTATDSDKYYYGMSHVKEAAASIEACLNDGYLGSGDPKQSNNKFANWKKAHRNQLHKEVLETFDSKAKAYIAEKELIGELWRTDSNCMNSAAGGRGHGANSLRINLRVCPIHGEVKHNGATCLLCVAAKTRSVGVCEIHGETIFWGTSCSRCSSLANIKMATCLIHGETKHKGKVCYKCEQQGLIKQQVCSIHGSVTHQGGTCTACTAENKNSMKICAIHGETKHQKDSCYKCMTISKNTVKSCSVHGEVKHYGDTCAKCALASTYTDGECARHGKVRLRKGNCTKCSSEKTTHTRFHSSPKADCSICAKQQQMAS